VRTTIDLPADLHQLTSALARSRGETLSQTVADILRRTLIDDGGPEVTDDPVTGLPLVRLGRPVTSEDVAALEDGP
jgi:hypothetical protein